MAFHHYRDCLVVGKLTRELPGRSAKGLTPLRGIDAVEPHFHGCAVSHDAQRIAITNADHLPGELLGSAGRGDKQQQDKDGCQGLWGRLHSWMHRDTSPFRRFPPWSRSRLPEIVHEPC